MFCVTELEAWKQNSGKEQLRMPNVAMDLISPVGISLLAVGAGLLFTLLRNVNSWLYEPRLLTGQSSLPPGDMGWPIIGTMLPFIRAFKSKDPNSFVNGFISRFGKQTGLYKTYMFLQPTILSTTPETNKLVMNRNDVFVSGWPQSTKTILGRKSFASIEGEDHKRLRRLTYESINGPNILKSFIPRIETMAKTELEAWSEKDCNSSYDDLRMFTFHVIASLFISYKPGPECTALCNEFEEFVHGLRAMPIKFPGTAYYRSLMSRRRMDVILQGIIDKRRSSQVETNEAPNHDVLEAMMANVDEDGRKLTDEEIIDTLVVYLLAGHESSAHTVLWIMILLYQHPHVWKKAREEVRKVHDAKAPGELLTFGEYKSMTYISKVVDETLRLVNVTPMVFREVKSDIQVNGHTIPKGWFVQPWFRMVHLDPEVFPDPKKFDPDRWDKIKLKGGMFTPFGAGYRMCPGNELAKLEITVFIYHLLLNYRWEPINPKSDQNLQFLPHPRPKDGYPVRIFKL